MDWEGVLEPNETDEMIIAGIEHDLSNFPSCEEDMVYISCKFRNGKAVALELDHL